MEEKIVETEAGKLPEQVREMMSRGGRLLTMVGTDERKQGGAYVLRYVFGLPAVSGKNRVETLLVRLDPERPSFLSVTPLLPAANWYEREVRDLLGLVPEGHPDPRPLVLHDPWPEGFYPLRKDFLPPPPEKTIRQGLDTPPDPRPRVEGEGVIAIPVGPIHAGIIEPGHFRFGAVGENVLHVDAKLFYTHRGLEKSAEGKSLEEGLYIAERACGACTVSHGVSYCQAVELALGITIPARAAYLRTVYLELERLYNHVGDVGNICAGTGFAFGSSNGGRLKEQLLRLNREISGHRYLRGVQAIGGVRKDLTPEETGLILRVIGQVEQEFKEIAGILYGSTSFMDRAATTGVLPAQTARDLGSVGVAARASGLDMDARRDWPHAAYGELNFPVITEESGDVLARIRVRVREAEVATSLIRQALQAIPGGAIQAPVPNPHDGQWRTGLGITESPRGENVHWVMVDPQGRLDRLRIRSASFANWLAMPLTVPGNIVPDFPLINKSFELCYACLDR